MLAIHVKNYLDNRNKSYNPCEAPGFGGKLQQKSAFWKAAFWEKKTNQWKGVEKHDIYT